MKKRLMMLLMALGVFMLMIVACDTGYAPTAATPTVPTVVNPGEIALTMIMQKADAEATQMMVNVQLTATGQIVNATATAQAYQFGIATNEQARQDVQATDARQRQDAAATEQRRREDAAATQARMDAVSTAEQDQRNVIGTATAQQAAIWNGMTMQAAPTHDMWTKQAVEQEQIIATNQVELSNLEVKRQQQSNTLQALGPYAVAFIAIVVAAIVMLRYSRTREIKNEETGVIEAIVLDNQTMIRPQLLPGAVLNLGKQPSVPLLTDSENQAEIVRRSQGVEAIRAIPPGTSPQVMGDLLSNILGGSDPAPRFQILNPSEAPPAQLLDANALKSLDQDWKDDNGKL